MVDLSGGKGGLGQGGQHSIQRVQSGWQATSGTYHVCDCQAELFTLCQYHTVSYRVCFNKIYSSSLPVAVHTKSTQQPRGFISVPDTVISEAVSCSCTGCIMIKAEHSFTHDTTGT
jgi:hypothetical protein